jgi:DNA-directed RNA polymerase specialized sigma24 family protein
MSPRFGRPRQGRRALETARHAPAPSTLLRRRIADTLAECSEEERNVLALLIGERLSPAEASLALEIPTSRVLRVRAALFDSLRRALLGERPARRAVATRSAAGTTLRRAS